MRKTKWRTVAACAILGGGVLLTAAGAGGLGNERGRPDPKDAPVSADVVRVKAEIEFWQTERAQLESQLRAITKESDKNDSSWTESQIDVLERLLLRSSEALQDARLRQHIMSRMQDQIAKAEGK